MTGLRDLYQEVIIDHARSPRNFHVLHAPCCKAEGYNPLCGDKLTLYLQLQADVIEEAAFIGSGCAISMASASLMTEALKGKTQNEALQLFTQFQEMVTQGNTADIPGKLAILVGVNEFPMRVKCATLAWHTLKAAFQEQAGMVSTED